MGTLTISKIKCLKIHVDNTGLTATITAESEKGPFTAKYEEPKLAFPYGEIRFEYCLKEDPPATMKLQRWDQPVPDTWVLDK
jgi:hypothetical protein